MGFLDNIFGKKECELCHNECGPMHRTKIKDKLFVCSDCVRECSEYVRLSNMTFEEVREHIDFMQHRERLYELFEGKNQFKYPNGSRYDQSGMVFVNELGMFAIKKRNDGKFKKYHEVIRYDEVAAYKPYEEKTTDSDGKEKFKEAGVVIRLADKGHYSEEMQKRGLHRHPFNYEDIKVCIVKKEEWKDEVNGIINRFDHIFGKHDNQTGLFSLRPSVNKQRELEAQVGMAKAMAGIIGAAVKGEEEPSDKLVDTFNKAKDAVDADRTHGLSEFSKNADAAEKQIL